MFVLNYREIMARMKQLFLATALIADSDSNILLVRKHGSEFFMQPGGKIDYEETVHQALIRELQEELNINVTPAQCQYLDSFKCRAANENNTYIYADLFLVNHLWAQKNYTPSSEIVEVKLINPFHIPPVKLAPFTEEFVFPLWRQRIGGCN